MPSFSTPVRRSAAAAACAVVAVLWAGSAAAATKIQGRLVVAPACDPALTPAADCVIDSLGKARFRIAESRKAGHDGVAFKLSFKKALKAGAAVDVTGATVVFLLSIDGGACMAYASPPFDLTGGNLAGALKFSGADTLPPVAAVGGSAVEPCGERVAMIAPGVGGDERVAVDGLVQGPVKPKTDLKGNIILNPKCDPAVTPSADCAVDSFKVGKFSVKSSTKAEDSGLSYKVLLKKAVKDDAGVTVPRVRVMFSMRTDGGSCFDVLSPVLELADGKLEGATEFTSADTFPRATPSPGSTLELCGHRVQVLVPGPAGSGADVVGVAGIVAGG